MRQNLSRVALVAISVALLALLAMKQAGPSGDRPAVGDVAPDFTLSPLGSDAKVTLAEVAQEGPVVLVVLRGYTGYQCPICTRQFGEYLARADDFEKAGATVVFVYPGPADDLTARADEFVEGKDYPAHFRFLLDPGYTFTNAYGLRWDAPNETAYPSTFVLDKSRKVAFANVSETHAGRTGPETALEALANQ